MTLSEYREKRNNIDAEFHIQLRKLQRAYAFSNNEYKVGDIFTDHIGSIIIEEITVSMSGEPFCVFIGSVLNKNGTISKREGKRKAYQINELKKTT